MLIKSKLNAAIPVNFSITALGDVWVICKLARIEYSEAINLKAGHSVCQSERHNYRVAIGNKTTENDSVPARFASTLLGLMQLFLI